MRLALTFAALLALFSAPASAQTIGFPGINDYTVNGSISGSQSCNLVTIPAPSVATFNVSTVPGGPVLLLFSQAPCVPCVAPFGNSPCLPPNIICAASNHSLDLLSIFATVGGTADAAGNFTFSAPIPASFVGLRLGTQSAIVNIGCGSPGLPSAIMSQAYDLLFI